MHQVLRTLDQRTIHEIREQMEPLALLPFEPGTEDRHLPSALLRWFKDQRPGLPGNTRAAEAAEAGFCESIVALLRGREVSHVCRVLGSWETRPDRRSPLELLAGSVARALGASLVSPMRRTAPRPPMSTQQHLSGRDALRLRIDYARQDLIWEGVFPGATFLILDDIRCLGASEAIWAAAAMVHGGAERATAVSLGQTASLAGDVEPQSDPGEIRAAGLRSGRSGAFFRYAWMSPQSRLWHAVHDCPTSAEAILWWRGLLRPGCQPCRRCTGRSRWIRDFLHSFGRGWRGG